VTASSGGTVYGNAATLPASEDLLPAPRSPYGAGKLCEEIYLTAFGILNGVSGMALRYANVYGPRQDGTGEAGVVAISCWRLAAGDRAIVYGDGEQQRDFVYVEDVAAANVAALGSEHSGPVNIGTGVSLSIRTVVEMLSQLYESEVGWEFGPPRGGEVRRTCLDPARAWERLGWSPSIAAHEGLRRTKQYFASEGKASTPAA
jgi:UDP-glucose 4-epimerase